VTGPPQDRDYAGVEPPVPGSSLSLAGHPAPPVRTGLEPEERARLNELRARVEARPYPFILGAGWDTNSDESERKACLLADWLNTLAARPDLDGDTRTSVRICLAQVELARFVLGDAELGAAYIRAARERHERSGAGP
jgi:hypothetical protein